MKKKPCISLRKNEYQVQSFVDCAILNLVQKSIFSFNFVKYGEKATSSAPYVSCRSYSNGSQDEMSPSLCRITAANLSNALYN